MQQLQQQYTQAKSHNPYRLWDKLPIFWSPAIEIATLSPNSSSDLEAAQQNIRQVFVHHRKRDIELTAAFQNPDILSCAIDFVKNSCLFELDDANQPFADRRILLVALEMNWVGVFSVVLLNMALCLGTGIGVGQLTGKIELGVAVTSGVAGVLACIQAVLFLIYK